MKILRFSPRSISGILMVCISFLFCGCPGPVNNGGPVPPVNNTPPSFSEKMETGIQIYDKQGNPVSGSYNIKFTNNNGDLVPAGTVKNGLLTLSLPKNMEDKDLEQYNKSNFPDGLGNSIDGIGFLIANFQLYEGDIPKGALSLSLSLSSVSGSVTNVLQYHYSNGEIKINGQGMLLFDTIDATYDINAPAGWSRIWYTSETTIKGVLNNKWTTDLSNIPGDIKWIFEPR